MTVVTFPLTRDQVNLMDKLGFKYSKDGKFHTFTNKDMGYVVANENPMEAVSHLLLMHEMSIKNEFYNLLKYLTKSEVMETLEEEIMFVK